MTGTAGDPAAFETVRRDAFPADVIADSPRWILAPDALWPALMPAAPRLLVHQARFHVGDVLWLTPLLRAIRRRFRRAEITVVGPPVARTVLADNPHVHAVVPYHEDGGKEARHHVFKALDRHGFDAALLAFARWPTSTWLAEELARRGVGVRVNLEYFDVDYDCGTIAPWATHEMWCVWASLASPEMMLHALDPFFERGATEHLDDRGLEYHVPSAAHATARQLLRERGLDGGPFVVLTPGGRSSERWPPERFAELASALVSELGVGVLVEGSEDEIALLSDVQCRVAPSARSRVHAAADPLDVFAAVLEKAQLLVSSDSAPIHFAAALGTPSVYFAQREKLIHSHPASGARALIGEDGSVSRIGVEQAMEAVWERVGG